MTTMQNLLYLLPLLACPLGMGLMGLVGWMIVRRNRAQPTDAILVQHGNMAENQPNVPADRLVALRAQLDDVQAHIGRLAAEPPSPHPVAADAAVSPAANVSTAR